MCVSVATPSTDMPPREEVISPSQSPTPIPNIDIESLKRLLPRCGFNVSGPPPPQVDLGSRLCCNVTEVGSAWPLELLSHFERLWCLVQTNKHFVLNIV